MKLKHIAPILFAGFVLATINVSHSYPTDSVQAARGYRACNPRYTVCEYAQMQFTSKTKVDATIARYINIRNHDSLEQYNAATQASLAVGGDLHIEALQEYDPITRRWVGLNGTTHCRYCLKPNMHSARSFPRRIVLFFKKSQQSPMDGYLAVGDDVAKGAGKMLDLVVTATPHVKIYADIRSHGVSRRISTEDNARHRFHVQLESGDVVSSNPDYVVISPIRSWATFAAIYKGRENSLVSGTSDLPFFHEKTDEETISDVVRYLKAGGWAYSPYTASVGDAFPSRKVADILQGSMADCKAFVTVFQAALLRSGIPAHPILLNHLGHAPLSRSVPSGWPDHVILYVPAVNKYVDVTRAIFGNETWQESAQVFRGYPALDVDTGKFVVVNEHANVTATRE